MRLFVSALLLAAVACTGDTRATAPETPDTAVVTPTLATTSTLPAPTTTSEPEEECEGADRGILCPPILPEIEVMQGGFLAPNQLAPGVYQTRFFEPRLEFAREEQFTSFGETDGIVFLDSADAFTYIINPTEGPYDLQVIADDECARRASIEEVSVLGMPAVLLDVTAGDCQINVPTEVLFAPLGEDWRAHFFVIDMGGGEELVVTVDSPAVVFDEYFEETAKPILDSVRFLDE